MLAPVAERGAAAGASGAWQGGGEGGQCADLGEEERGGKERGSGAGEQYLPRMLSTSLSPLFGFSLSPSAPPPSPFSQRIMAALPAGEQAGGAGGQVTYADLQRADAAWLALRSAPPGGWVWPPPLLPRCAASTMNLVSPCAMRHSCLILCSHLHPSMPLFHRSVPGPPTTSSPQVVVRKPGNSSSSGSEGGGAAGAASEVEVVVCGGTLGVFVAVSLALRGQHVGIVERGTLRGRAQEWNVSRREVQELVAMGVLTAEEVDDAITVTFNPCRCGFAGGEDMWVRDILNLGISPARLIEAAKQRFLALGGVLLEGVALTSLNVYDDAAVLHFADPSVPALKARLVVDAMGHASPIVRQARWGQKPDGVCLVVGTCARGFPPETNSTGDIIFTTSPTISLGKSPLQLFWEAFPSGSGPSDRTTYMFSYMDAQPERPSLEAMLDLYWHLMPPYQGIDSIDSVEVQRVLFGFFPTFRDSPLCPAFDRVIQVGDASGIQSPLSFGGFGAITRHLGRITDGLVEALSADLLTRDALASINPYQPNLSGAWLLQRAMSARVGSSPPPDFINTLLATNFAAMQDVTQFAPLALTMGSMVVTRPSLLPTIFLQVGPVPLLDWLQHFIALAAFSALHHLASALSLSLSPSPASLHHQPLSITSLSLTSLSSQMCPSDVLSSGVALPLLPIANSYSHASPPPHPIPLLPTPSTPLIRSEAVASLPPRQRFFWSRRLEAWQFGSGLDYHL
ncbi:unnamed protein product [Closterium sp. Naga37s-1]|nr:unnamed protein product [Closterium sp. Naga37s-1]